MEEPFPNRPFYPQPEEIPLRIRVMEMVRANLFPVAVIGAGAMLAGMLVLQFIPSTSSSGESIEELQVLAERARASRTSSGETGNRRTVSIFSEPSGAVVYLEDSPVGITPLRNYPVADGELSLSLEKSRYVTRDTVIFISDDRPLTYSFELEARSLESPEPSQQLAQPASPSRQQPSRQTDPPQQQRSEPRQQPQQQQQNIAAVPEPEPPPVEEEAAGSISVLVRPWGTIYIDGAVRQRDTDVTYRTELSPGSYLVTAVHPSLGVLSRTVNVSPNESENVVFDFNETYSVTVTSTPAGVYGEIFVNGRATGFYTPQRITLPVGEHRIEVRRDGYVAREGPRVIALQGDRSEPVSFHLDEVNTASD